MKANSKKSIKRPSGVEDRLRTGDIFDLSRFTEGKHYKIVRGTVRSLIPNEARNCPSCGLFLPASSFYSALHATCRKCVRVDGKPRGLFRKPKKDKTPRMPDHLVPEAFRMDYAKAITEQAEHAESISGDRSLDKKRNREREQLARMLYDRELAGRILARRRLMPYVLKFNPGYLAGWVHNDIASRLEQFLKDVVDRKSPRLLFLLPPRSGKSKLVSQEFPSWAFGCYDWLELITASYNAALPMDFSRAIRDRLRDPAYHAIFQTRLDPESQSIEEWRTLGGGVYRAAGVGGGITGKGAHIFLVDDPVKNWEEADSASQREATWAWWLSTGFTRLAPGGGVLGVQTWWNEDDWAGRIQAAMATGEGDVYEVVKYPAVNDQGDEYIVTTPEGRRTIIQVPENYEPKPGDVLTRPKGTALHPERYSIEMLTSIKSNYAALGQMRMWHALYQQNPTPDEGAFIQRSWFRYDDLPAETFGRKVFQTWDFSITTRETSDWIVGYCAVLDERNDLHELDMVRFRSDDSTVISEAILDFFDKWGCFVAGVEDGQIWKTMRPVVERRAIERKIPFNYHPLLPVTDKMVRGGPLRGHMQLGKWHFLKNAPFRAEVDKELLHFPSAKNDDIYDAVAWLTRLALLYPTSGHRPAPKKPKSWKDKLKSLATGGHMSA